MTFNPYIENLGPHFTKFFITPNVAIHHFTAPDFGDFHDHPFDIEVKILRGEYTEEIMQPDWNISIIFTRYEGDHFIIPANHIHRIIALPENDCTTIAYYGTWQRKSRFWRFGEIVECRNHDQTEWEQVI